MLETCISRMYDGRMVFGEVCWDKGILGKCDRKWHSKKVRCEKGTLGKCIGSLVSFFS